MMVLRAPALITIKHLIMFRLIAVASACLLALSSCSADKQPKDLATPLMRDHYLTAETPLDAKLADWALETYRAETPNLVSIRMVPNRRMRIPGHTGPDSVAQGYLQFLLDRAGGDGGSGYQRNVYIPCYKQRDGSFRLARFPNPHPGSGTGSPESGPWITANVSCMGVNCSACELRSIPWASMHCGCARIGDPSGGPSYCNMSITMGLGTVLDNMTEAIPADYSYMPL